MSDYVFLSNSPAGPDVVKLQYWDFQGIDGVQVWGKIKTRKSTKCAVTGNLIVAGDRAFRSFGNETNRGQRISLAGMKQLKKEVGING